MAHILIADDDDLIAVILSDALADAGHPSHWVASAEAAWESVHARRPDLLLLDQDMPGLPGLALLARLRGSPLLYDMPVVMLTATRADSERGVDEETAMQAGAQDFIRKPFAPEALAARIEAALERDVSPSPGAASQDEIARENGIATSSDCSQRHLPTRPRA